MKKPKDFRILIACEESQIIMKEFRNMGFTAFSCDIQESSGKFPEFHIKDNIFNIINEKWDMMIGHPPCTYLSYAGNRYFNIEKYKEKALNRYVQREEAVLFFLKLWNCKIPHILLENPMGYIHKVIKCNQIIHPYYFGDKDCKRTCLWLKNLPPLLYCLENNLFEYKTSCNKPQPKYVDKSGRNRYFTDSITHKDEIIRRKLRSKTFPGIAKAIADQYGNFLINKYNG
jgi:hypothetical protein